MTSALGKVTSKAESGASIKEMAPSALASFPFSLPRAIATVRNPMRQANWIPR